MTDREILRLWAKWWDGPGRQSYSGVVLPPLTATRNTLACGICQGIIEGGEVCAACGRRLDEEVRGE